MSHGKRSRSSNGHGPSDLDRHPDGEQARPFVERFCAGDADAVGLAWNEYGGRFTRRLQRKYWIALSRDRCEQIALDAVELAWEHRLEFLSAEGCFEAWLWGIACHRATDELRKPWFQERCQETALAPEKLFLLIDQSARIPGQEQDADVGIEARDLIDHSMRVLSAQEHAILSADMDSPSRVAPSSELSQHLGLAESTVRSSRAHGLAKLKAELLRLGYLPRRLGRDFCNAAYV